MKRDKRGFFNFFSLFFFSLFFLMNDLPTGRELNGEGGRNTVPSSSSSSRLNHLFNSFFFFFNF